MLCLTGNIMSHLIGQGRGQLHELPDHLATLRGLTKWASRIDHPTAAGEIMRQAFREMLSGRQRPVGVEAPWDVFGMTAEVDLPGRLESVLPPRPDPDGVAAVAAVAALIRAARKPLIMVGSGAIDAQAEVAALARVLQAPVTAHRSGKGILPDDDPLVLLLPAA